MTVKNNTKPATTSDYQEIYDKESKQPYFKKILDLLSKYEDGWNVFIKAHELQRYDIPVPRKEEFQDDPYLPNSWMELSDAVLSIIAKEKFKLNTAENIIEIVRLDQMLDAYVRPIPGAPNHWTYGKKRIAEEKKYDYSKNIAYEIIINTNPCLAYYMENNSPTMQLLVNAHASQGHNAVYTNNRYFKRYTHASSIMAINERFRDTVEECNVKYGHDEVEKLLDFCQAMALMDTDDVPAKLKKTKAEMEAARLDAEEANYKVKRPKGIFDTNYSDDKTDDSKLDLSFPAKGKKNVLSSTQSVNSMVDYGRMTVL